MPAPRDNISIVQRLNCWVLNSTTIGGGGVPNTAAVRLPTTTPNTSARKTDSSDMPASTAGDRLRFARRSRAMSQAPTPIRHSMNRRGPQAPAGDSSAYLDPAARRLVAAARTRRETMDRSITAYRTRVRERIGVGVRALRRDRMLYRREIALLVDWRRDGVSQIAVIGARQSVLAAMPKPTLPEDLTSDGGDYAFDPANDRLTIGWSSARRDSTQDSTRHRDVDVRHPLA